MNLLTITPGSVRVGAVTVEITGQALDALTLAEHFVQVFDLGQAHQIETEGINACDYSSTRHAGKAITVGVALWKQAEKAYAGRDVVVR